MMLAELSSSDQGTIFLAIAIVAFCLAVWRATERDVLGTCLCAAIGVVILIVAV